MRQILSLIFGFLVLLFTVQTAHAENNSFITIVNPQRISVYNKDYLGSFKAQVKEIESKGLPATWPVTYDVLTRNDFVEYLKKLGQDQELGIFLEVTPSFTKAADVIYHQTSSWHYATSLFLSGYKQEDRKKLIDTVFKKFKETFGYYPKSVGAWWVDSYSLSYMKQKYGITGTLNVSDQYDLDNYQVWGTWWSVPYYPSKINAAVPAQDKEEKIDVVTFRWAARDPLNGYANDLKKLPSLFSLQDYSPFASASYFKDLLELYSFQKPYNQFGHVTVGIEGDLTPGIYESQFANHLEIIKTLLDEGKVQVLSMKDFSSWYRNSFPDASPIHIISSDDLVGQNKKSIWINSPLYRINLVYNTETRDTKILDFRAYYKNFEVPFYNTPNKQIVFSINLPYIIDSVIDPSSKATFNLGELKEINSEKLVFEKGEITFQKDKIEFPKNLNIPNFPNFNSAFPIPQSGILIKDYFLRIPFALKHRLHLNFPNIPFPFAQTYYVSQTEIDGLTVLKRMASGNVLVYDKDCLKCTFSSQFKPAAAAGVESYVSKYSSKPVAQDISFLLAKNSVDAKKILKDKKIKYVYLARYESYVESLPYSPEDLGLERIYRNANAEIWKVK